MIQDTKALNTTLQAIKSDYNLIVQQGGTYSGKTYSILIAIVLYMQSLKEKVKISRVIGQSYNEMTSGSYADWEEIMEETKAGVCVSKVKRQWRIGQNILEFRAVDTEGKAKSGKSHLVFFNECNHIPYPIYRQIALRSEIRILDYNPSSKFWFHKKVLPTVDQYKWLFKITTYLDNPTLSPQKVREIEALATDDYMRDVYMLGIMPALEGAVFDFRTYKEDRELRTMKNHGYFLDFGFTNDPTTLGEAGMEGRKIYCKEHIYETGLLTKDINERMIALGIDKSRPIYCDNIPKEVAELAVYGWRLVKTKKYAGSIIDTINLLKQHEIYVHEKSLNAINEFENYQWVKKNGEFINVPIEKFNHFCDGLRYYGQFNCSSTIRAVGRRVSTTNII